MEHNTRDGRPRLLERCDLPLTALGCAKRVYTDIAVIDVTPSGFLVEEIADGISRDELQARTGAKLAFAPECRVLRAPVVGESR